MLKGNGKGHESWLEETSGSSADDAEAVLAEPVALSCPSQPLKGVDSVKRNAASFSREKSPKMGEALGGTDRKAILRR